MRVLIADDHALFRDGLASLLGAWGHDIVGQAADGEEAVERARALRPDLVLMDVRMPHCTGLEATHRLAGEMPGTAIVMLTASEDEDDLFEAIKAGARGYVLKDVEAPTLRAMIEGVARGEAAISPLTAARILTELARPSSPIAGGGGSGGRPGSAAGGPDALTEREREVLEYVVDGLRNKEIAATLGISENTAKYHLRNILDKLHAESRTEVAARAIREGLVRQDDHPAR